MTHSRVSQQCTFYYKCKKTITTVLYAH